MKWNNTNWLLCTNFALKTKNQLIMIQLSKKMLIFAISFINGRQHRGKLFRFDPSENLENSMYAGEKCESRCQPKAEWSLLQLCRSEALFLKSCSSCSSIYTACSLLESAHIYTCRCELIFILTHTGIPEPSD